MNTPVEEKTTHEQAATLAPSHPGPAASAGGKVRWTVCALLFFATTINYIDRQVIGILKPELKDSLHWTETDFAQIVFWFQVAYAGGYLFSGRLVDWIGSRVGLALSVTVWSLAEIGHAIVHTVTGFSCARFWLGLAEGGNFPAAIRSVAEWFPKRERALATGLFNSGANVGALVTPILVPWLSVHYGWPSAFVVTGALGLVWLIFWLLLYQHPERHRRLSPAERAYIMSDPPEKVVKMPWLKLLGHRQTWVFCVGQFLTGPVGWFYLYWAPGFLHDHYGVDTAHLGPPLIVIYQMTFFGSIIGGWIPSRLMKRGWGVNGARKMAFLICALAAVPVFITPQASKWTAVFLVGLAYAGHMGFVANLFTLVSDTVPRQAISSVVGLGGTAAAIGGMFSAKITGKVLDLTGNNYQSLFIAASVTYLLALLIMHLLNPRNEPMRLEARARAEGGGRRAE